MLEAVLESLNNWFDRDGLGRFHHVERGELSVEGGSLLGAGGWLKPGQWFRIEGSAFNDGLHRHPATDLADEAFEGAAYALHVPPAVVELSERVAEWEEANGEASRGVYVSQSVPTASVTMRDGMAASDGRSGWETVFSGEMRRFRKVCP